MKTFPLLITFDGSQYEEIQEAKCGFKRNDDDNDNVGVSYRKRTSNGMVERKIKKSNALNPKRSSNVHGTQSNLTASPFFILPFH
ncbi:CLUMA_CG013063, isoform A [Clunio marinus]|uniref:CLUMA_CG013063, isoform A n=1 Tax=Clunio marinus TaxID=568069 RepID=A0A1J1IHD1_9DIPT|nr:CLUMA_CG013063, isoform A [Clunio marinus]